MHHVGSLRLHKAVSYEKACKGWVCIRTYGKGEDYYVHGTKGTSTFECPLPLMTPEERDLTRRFRRCEAAVHESLGTIEGLQFDIGKSSATSTEPLLPCLNTLSSW